MRAGLVVRGLRARRALQTARALDKVVDSQLSLVVRLPECGRRRSADYLAELVMLAQAYRHYAAGWIAKEALDRRADEVMARLDGLRDSRLADALPRDGLPGDDNWPLTDDHLDFGD